MIKRLTSFITTWKRDQKDSNYFINDELYDHIMCSLKSLESIMKEYGYKFQVNTCCLSALIVENFFSCIRGKM